MSPPAVTVYSTPTCSWCYRAKEFLVRRAGRASYRISGRGQVGLL
ncbi:MAG TPA: glutaredoxin domain-containing protein [Chloroflexota bacterium]